MIMKSERFFDDREGSGTARTGPEIRWVCGVSRVCNVLSAGVCGWGWPARPAGRGPAVPLAGLLAGPPQPAAAAVHLVVGHPGKLHPRPGAAVTIAAASAGLAANLVPAGTRARSRRALPRNHDFGR